MYIHHYIRKNTFIALGTSEVNKAASETYLAKLKKSVSPFAFAVRQSSLQPACVKFRNIQRCPILGEKFMEAVYPDIIGFRLVSFVLHGLVGVGHFFSEARSVKDVSLSLRKIPCSLWFLSNISFHAVFVFI